MPPYTLPKGQILRKRKDIEDLFANGVQHFAYPLKTTILITTKKNDDQSLQVLYLVPKRIHKRAVTRNKLRRRIKESFRLQNKSLRQALQEQNNLKVLLVVSYIAKDHLTYEIISDAMQAILEKVADLAANTAR